MKHLVDTCGWIEWLTNSNLAKTYEPYLTKLNQLLIPTILQYELYKWVYRERDEITALEVLAITEQGNVITLESKLATFAADISMQYKLSMADAIVYATSLSYSGVLITSDAHFKNLPHVKYFKK